MKQGYGRSLPKGWELKNLGELVNIRTGKLDSNAMIEGGKYPFFTCSRQIFAINEYAFDCEAILLAGNNASGDFNVKHYKGKFNAYQRTYVITVNDDNRILYSYLNQQLINHLKKFKEQSVGANTKFLKIGMIRGMEIPLPPIQEQQRLVATLDEVFAAIAKAKANAEQNLKNAKELFESYLQEVFENKGEGWEEKTLNQISENLDSKRVPITKNLRSEGLIPYYGASGIVDYVADYLFDEDLLCVSEDGANLLARTYPIAFSITGKTWVNNHAHILRFESVVSQRFVELYLNSIKLDDFVTGMAQPKLNQAMLNKIPIPFPPIEQQVIIVLKLDILSAETKKLEAIYQQKINDLEELKKSVLQKAFVGELKTIEGVAV
jgi:type I restriction enzyme S subunit